MLQGLHLGLEMGPSVLPASRVCPQAPAAVTGHQHESGCEQGPSQVPTGGDRGGSCPQKATPLRGTATPWSCSKGGCKQGKWRGERSQKQRAEENGEGKRQAPAAQHSDPLPEAEAAEEEEGERAKAALRCGDGCFFHMAATPRYGRPGPIPVRL